MMAGVKAARAQLLVISFGAGTEPQESKQQSVFFGFAPFSQEWLHMIGMFEVLMAVVTAGMFGDKLIAMIKAEAFRVEF